LFPEDEILSFLSKRKEQLEGVVISGGEPLLQEDIVGFIENVKKHGFLVKIDTNGSCPEKLAELLDKNLVDYIAMDVKAPKEKYRELTGVDVDIAKIEESILLIKDNAPAYEFKTTFVPGLLRKEDIVEIAKWLKGAERFYLQQFKPISPLVSSTLENTVPYSKGYFVETLTEIKSFFKYCAVRGI
jgi:pyruvate formate lyase activating enzyme